MAHMTQLPSCLVVFMTLMQAGYALQTARCTQALGMESGKIPNNHITASSHYDAAVNSFHGRAHKDTGGGAWCPRAMIFDEGKEFLEINLVNDHVITKVEVQGRFGNGQGKEFAQQYKLQYYRYSLDKWVTYRDGHGSELLDGNTNTYLPKESILKPPFIASRIRFIPYSDHPRTVCMRVEVYGCVYKGGIVSYTMKDGEVRGRDDGLQDVTYDGEKVGNHLSGGLGQLTDGEIGHTNYRVDYIGQREGYEWVGWKNVSQNKQPVEMIFSFDEVRNFTSVHIFVNNFFTKDVQAFSRANILFSIDGGEHYHKGIEFEESPDRIFEEAYNVTVKLREFSANTIKIQLYFTMKWIMVSEVDFDSVPCGCNVSGLFSPQATVASDTMYADQTPIPVSSGDLETSAPLIAGLIALGVVSCLLPIAIGVLYYRTRWQKKALTPPSSSDGIITKNFSKKMNDTHINMDTAKHDNGNNLAKGRFYGDVAMEEEVAAMYQQPYKVNNASSHYFTLIQNIPFDDPMKNLRDPDDSVDYAVPEMTLTTMTPPPPFTEMYQTPPPIPLSKPPSLLSFNRKEGTPPPPILPIPPPPEHEYYACPKLTHVHTDIRGVSGTVLYMNETCYTKREKSIPNIPTGIYNVMEIVGSGEYGIVQICRIKDSVSSICKNITPGAVCLTKKLKPGVGDEIIQSFKEEATILSKLDHVNIAKVLGIANVYESHTMLVEYAEHGDLCYFLRAHTLASTLHTHRNKITPVVTISDLIYIAAQIASAMAYFETNKFIHRDLAARNCLVGEKLSIKISDAAISRPIYHEDYYKPDENLMLPIRWMSSESVFEGNFSNKSDVWAFGVTLWELFTLGTIRPYDEFSDSGVLENLAHHHEREDSTMIMLPQPSACSRDVYQIMRSCWQQDTDKRPSFCDLHSFLQRKNVGPSH